MDPRRNRITRRSGTPDFVHTGRFKPRSSAAPWRLPAALFARMKRLPLAPRDTPPPQGQGTRKVEPFPVADVSITLHRWHGDARYEVRVIFQPDPSARRAEDKGHMYCIDGTLPYWRGEAPGHAVLRAAARCWPGTQFRTQTPDQALSLSRQRQRRAERAALLALCFAGLLLGYLVNRYGTWMFDPFVKPWLF